MPPVDAPKLPLTSCDVHAERVAHLRELFPEAFTEGKADLRKLAQLFGDARTDAVERYGLSWAGKSDALRNIQTLTSGTLLPCPEESWPPLPFAGVESPQGLGVRQPSAALAPEANVANEKRQRTGAVQNAGASATPPSAFNISENLIIEGDNLEVLKLLHGGYHGRVKMIYIDPPYNTGGEFIYPDNYKEGLADYLRFSGQVSGEGVKLTTNAETDGRYHSKWLTMMYPRLFLARNLLREDGVIFVSIDDHEVYNLRAVMNEIFGEENFIAEMVWEGAFKNDARQIGVNHEYVLVFARDRPKLPNEWTIAKEAVEPVLAEVARLKTEFGEDYEAASRALGAWFQNNKATPSFAHRRFRYIDKHGAYKEDDPTAPGGRRIDLFHPKTRKVIPLRANRGWSFDQKRFEELDADGRITYVTEDSIMVRRYLHETDHMTPQSVLYQPARSASERLNRLLGDMLFDFPKDENVIRQFVEMSTTSNDLILDFFAGSGTTAQAVLELNAQDGGNRRFILVQLPEPTNRPDFPTIADITKERVRRVLRKLEGEIAAKELKERKESEGQLLLTDRGSVTGSTSEGKTGVGDDSDIAGRSGDCCGSQSRAPDLGFKVFKLAGSNFKVWDSSAAPTDAAGLAEQLQLMADNLVPGRPDEALLYELILKSNLPLTSRVVASRIGAQTYYDTADGALAICLERPVTQETLRGLIARKPRGVICLDVAFAGNDQLKANTVLEMKALGIEFHTA